MKKFLSLAAVTFTSIALLGCGEKQAPSVKTSEAKPSETKSSEAKTNIATASTNDPNSITPDGSLVSRIKVGPITEASILESLRVPGRVETNLYNTARIGAPITGRISKIDVRFGQEVKAGQTLAEISSPDLAQAQLSFLRAHSQLQSTTRAVERAQLLLSADVIGSAELLRRQSEQQVAAAEKRATSDQLRSLGISPSRIAQLEASGQIQSTANISATNNGTVIDLKVSQGQVVNPSDVLFVVSDLNELWGLAELPEQDSRFVKKGQRVQVEVPSLGQEKLTGEVRFVADIVNPETRTVRIGVTLANKDRALKPSMLMTMLIEGKSVVKPVVPQAAVVRENDADHLYVKQSNGAFKLTKVELGPETNGQRALLKPMPKDTQIVLDGAFHMNNVRQQRAVSG